MGTIPILMNRFVLALPLVLAVLFTACGGDDAAEEPAGQADSPAATVGPADSGDGGDGVEAGDADQSEESDDGPGDAAPAETGGIDGPAAPDFVLALGDGGSYTLSDGAKPVYLVFWAEW